MANYFERLEHDTAIELEQLSRLLFELRENRSKVLAPYGVENEVELLQQIQAGTVAEHPAYEQYLAARILADTRETVRAVVSERVKEVNRT
jgi:hypothetical protein